MSLEIKEISPRQRRVLQKLAEGLAPLEVAKQTGYSPEHISRLSRSPQVKIELHRLRANIEEQLALELPAIIGQALNIIITQLSSPNHTARTEAAKFVMRYLGKPFMERMVFSPDPDSDQAIEIQPVKEVYYYTPFASLHHQSQDLDSNTLNLLSNLADAKEIGVLRDNLLALLEQLPNAHPLKVDLLKAQTIDDWAVWQTAVRWHKFSGVTVDETRNATDQNVATGVIQEANDIENDFTNQSQGGL